MENRATLRVSADSEITESIKNQMKAFFDWCHETIDVIQPGQTKDCTYETEPGDDQGLNVKVTLTRKNKQKPNEDDKENDSSGGAESPEDAGAAAAAAANQGNNNVFFVDTRNKLCPKT
jgi:hypothetical protein